MLADQAVYIYAIKKIQFDSKTHYILITIVRKISCLDSLEALEALQLAADFSTVSSDTAGVTCL